MPAHPTSPPQEGVLHQTDGARCDPFCRLQIDAAPLSVIHSISVLRHPSKQALRRALFYMVYTLRTLTPERPAEVGLDQGGRNVNYANLARKLCLPHTCCLALSGPLERLDLQWCRLQRLQDRMLREQSQDKSQIPPDWAYSNHEINKPCRVLSIDCSFVAKKPIPSALKRDVHVEGTGGGRAWFEALDEEWEPIQVSRLTVCTLRCYTALCALCTLQFTLCTVCVHCGTGALLCEHFGFLCARCCCGIAALLCVHSAPYSLHCALFVCTAALLCVHYSSMRAGAAVATGKCLDACKCNMLLLGYFVEGSVANPWLEVCAGEKQVCRKERISTWRVEKQRKKVKVLQATCFKVSQKVLLALLLPRVDALKGGCTALEVHRQYSGPRALGGCISIAGALLEESIWAEESSCPQQQSVGPVLITHGEKDVVTSRESVEM
eukprot:783933-Pelagomonas_calceolata.AAC.4